MSFRSTFDVCDGAGCQHSWYYDVDNLEDVFRCVVREISSYATNLKDYSPSVISNLRKLAHDGELDGLITLWNEHSTLQIRYDLFTPESVPPLTKEELDNFLINSVV